MSAELIACPKCNRKSNTLRAKCMYCGEDLPVDESLKKDLSSQAAKMRERDPSMQLDPLSQMTTQFQQSLAGFNVVLLNILEEKRSQASEAVATLGFHTSSETKPLLNLSRPMAVARYQSEAEAKLAEGQLRAAQLPVLIVKDDDLQADKPNRRVRKFTINVINGTSLSFTLDGFEEEIAVNASDIVLIVEGRIRFYESDATEENKSFGKTVREITEATEYVNEQTLIDIYTKSLEKSFRIRAESFDYSGLGSKMKLTALENLRVLQTVLRDIAKSAIYDTDFKQASKFLEPIWPYSQRQQSWGLKRNKMLGTGKVATRSVHYKDNELQFNRYSRLHYHLLPKTSEETSQTSGEL
ncbi:MAG: hypothetical protein HY819_18320 [Acidobacteria bacterium]|nr:hypothetical protein [Acidobacteriota bacterium]